MRILLTGATGTVGRYLGKEIIRNGHELTVLVRNANTASMNLPFPAEVFSWKTASEALAGSSIDCVIHLAGENISAKAWTKKRLQELKDSRVETTKFLVGLFDKTISKPKIWINASAIGFYGTKTNVDAHEGVAKGEGFLADLCDEWEKASEPVISWETRRVILRIGVVLEKRSGLLKEVLPIFRSGLGGVIGDGKQHLSWIHIDDLVRIILLSIRSESVSGVVNAVSPQFCSNTEFTKALSKALMKPSFVPISKWMVALWLGFKRASLAFADQKVQPLALMTRNFKWHFPTIEKAIESLIDYEKDFLTQEFYAEQWLPSSLENTFSFFADEKNLERITPPWLNFKVIRKSSEILGAGSLIDYKLKIKKIPAFWRTRIETWDPPNSFTDLQLKGPYDLWHHSHKFESLGVGTLMTDRVIYRLPLKAFGLPALLLVRNDIQKIFQFRRKIIGKSIAGSNTPKLLNR